MQTAAQPSPWLPAHTGADTVTSSNTAVMTNITIHDLDDALIRHLQHEAAVHGRSTEEQAHAILRSTLNPAPHAPANLAASIRAKFAPLGGVDLPIVPREQMREPPSFSE